MKTRDGIYYDLDESEYITKFNNLVFYFSSFKNKERFDSAIDSFTYYESLKMESRFNVKLDIKEILAITLYKRIEKRGLKIEYKYNDKIYNYDEIKYFSIVPLFNDNSNK